MSPPCSTFSRATFANRAGPPPLRNSDWPEGFPWLSGALKVKAETGTALVRRALSMAVLASAENIPWLIEHPEFLGATAAGTPASIWTWEEAVQVFRSTQAASVAFHQCAFGAQHRKPTRVAGTWYGLRTLGVAGWPRLDRSQHYRGPLARSCGHTHAPLYRYRCGGSVCYWSLCRLSAWPLQGACQFGCSFRSTPAVYRIGDGGWASSFFRHRRKCHLGGHGPPGRGLGSALPPVCTDS